MRKGRNDYTNEEKIEDVVSEKSEEIDKSKKKVSKNKKQIIILIVFCIIVVLTTLTVILIKLNNNNEIVNTTQEEGTINDLETKKESEDKKYLLTGYDETYFVNPLTFTEKQYKKGKIKVNKENYDKIDVSYYEVSGLVDKNIQNKINKEIKESAISITESLKSNEYTDVYTSIVGNFNNVLSIRITAYVYNSKKQVINNTKYTSLNYNLATGEKIKFLDLFASNTPINTLISNLYYKALAWKTDNRYEAFSEKWQESLNINNRDTSEYEDKILKAVRAFEKLDKDELNYTISPNSISVMETLDKEIDIGAYNEELYKYIDYVTVYKKFLTDKDIYENKITQKRLVFNSYYSDIKIIYQGSYVDNSDFYTYGFKNDDMFIYYLLTDYSESYTKSQKNLKDSLVKKYIDQSINNVVKKYNTNNNDYIVRGVATSDIYEQSNDVGKEKVISVSISVLVSKMNKGYLRDDGLKALAVQNIRKYADVYGMYMGSLSDNNIKNINEEENEISFNYYFDLKGKLIAKSYEELEKYINNKYKENNNDNNIVNVYNEI